MYQEPLFLEPVFKERIWGGQKLNTEFNYAIPNEPIGEAWVISAHPNGPSKIINGEFAGKTLLDVWGQQGELFNKEANNNEAFPLLTKILDAAADLSVQVHPDDTYARDVEGEPYGKTECWYVLSAEEGAEIVCGHHAEMKDELAKMVEEGKWDDLLRRVPVKAGDFIYVPSGTIHAIGAGLVILEVQQSSDITYRVYDYDRTDAEGNTRELHLDSSVEVTTVPHHTPDYDQVVEELDGLTAKRLVTENYFTVYHWDLDGEVSQTRTVDFLQVSVVDGQADLTIDGKTFTIKKGDNFIIPATITDFHLSGKAECLVSYPTPTK